MKKLLLTTTLTMLVTAPVFAQSIPDPLHGCYTTGCTGFGAVTIANPASGGLSNWGFTSSPGAQSGQLYVELLVPDNEGEAVFPTLTGKYNGNPMTIGAWVNVGLFTPGSDLTTVVGLSASPKNPYDAYAPDTHTLDPSFVAGTDFYTVYQAIVTAPDPMALLGGGQSSTLNDVFSFTGGDYTLGTNEFTGIGPGAIITAFLDTSVTGGTDNGIFSTAQSSSLILDVPGVVVNPLQPGVPEPSTWVMGLLGFGFLSWVGRSYARPRNIAV